MTKSLPLRPSLEHLKHQAKSLLRAEQVGQPTMKLAEAQRAIAQEYGFRTWADLKHHVEDLEVRARSQEQQIARLLACCLDGELSRAERWLQQLPHLVSLDIYLAAACGEVALVQSMIDTRPEWLHAPGGPLHATPLVYACSSRFGKPQQSREPALRRVVELLLQRGADPNAFWRNPDFGNCPLSALYGACGVNGNPFVAQLLLDAGATPDDNESLYHSVEHDSCECTELLLARGATIRGTNAMHQAVSLGNVPALRLLLAGGGNVNEPIAAQQMMTLLHWAIECHQGQDVLDVLIEHGADTRATTPDGLTPYRRAARVGHRVALEVLSRAGIAESLSVTESFMAACMTGDETVARRLLTEMPTFLADCERMHHSLLYAAAWRGSLDAVRTLLALGCDVGSSNATGATALHAAAWQGYDEIVRLLLTHRAPLDTKETQFHCTPIEWALHGSVNCRRHFAAEPPADDRAVTYAAIVSALLAAGSPLPVDRLIGNCPEPVEAVLADAGILPPDDLTS